MIVYEIVNKLNGKRYVGQTIQPLKRRLKNHLNHKNSCSAIRSAIEKYGIENFEINVLCECEGIEDLNKAEISYIEKLNTMFPHGYNLRNGGDNYRLTDLQKSKISTTLKAKGIRPPSRKGTNISEDHKKSIREASKKRTKEQIKKWRNNIVRTSNKSVICLEDQLCFKSMSDAAKHYSMSVSSVWRVCSRQKSNYKNKTFRYIGD